MLLGNVWVRADEFQRPAPQGLVTVERLEGPTWLKTGEAVLATDGSVAVGADRLLAAGTYIRSLNPDDYWWPPTWGAHGNCQQRGAPPRHHLQSAATTSGRRLGAHVRGEGGSGDQSRQRTVHAEEVGNLRSDAPYGGSILPP
jgi:hypothetical protein